MVDINLFKDEEGEERELNPESENLEDSLDGLDDFDFDEPLNALDSDDLDSSLEEDSELLEDESMPDLEGHEELEPEGDYDYGESNSKGTPLWVWGALAAAMVLVFLWFFVFQPKLSKTSPSESRLVTKPVTTPAQTQPDTLRQAKAEVKDTVRAVAVPPVTEAVSGEGIGVLSTYALVANKVVENFTSSGQFAGMFLSGEGFFAIEYVSRSKGVGSAMAHRVKTLLGVGSVKLSPEDSHIIKGKRYYLGVISGTLPQGGAQQKSGSAAAYASGMDFEKALRRLAAQRNQRVNGFEKLSSRSRGSKKQSDYRIKLQGNRAKLNALLQGLRTLGGNAYILKLNLAPSNYTDFNAQSVKLTLEYRLIY